jgi:hypothetical protein
VPLIDEVLPQYDARERHSVASARTVEDALALPLASDPVVRVLFRMRGLRTTGTIGDLFRGMTFVELARSETEVVLGAAGTPWRPSGGLVPFAEARPGMVRVAVDFVADGERLSTETRIEAMDERARRAFMRYWRVVGPFSGVIRRRWLRQIAR